MTYVSPSDDVWLYEKVAREKRIIAGKEEPREGEVIPWAAEAEHPYNRYMSGESRFDLQTVRDYHDPEVKATEFKLRRASLTAWAHVRDEIERGRTYAARVTALSYMLVSIEGLTIPSMMTDDGKLDLGRGEFHSAPISNNVLDRLRQAIGDREFDLLASACINANASLSESEKKLSGSGRGGRR